MSKSVLNDSLCAFSTKSPPPFLSSFSLSFSPSKDPTSSHCNDSVLSQSSVSPLPTVDTERGKCGKAAGSEGKRTVAKEQKLWECSPAPQPETAEKTTLMRPSSSQSLLGIGRTASPVLDPTHFNRPAFQPFLRELLLWLDDEQTAVLSRAIRPRAESLSGDLAKCKLLDVPKCIRLMRELEPFSRGFPPLLCDLYNKARSRPAPDPALQTAKARLDQSAAAITFKKLSDLKAVSQPSAEVEVICLAFLLLLGHIDGTHVLTLHRNAWKAFQIYLQQPGRCLQVLKRTSFSVESGTVGEGTHYADIVEKLRAKVEKINESGLRGSEAKVAGAAVLRYIKETIEFHRVVWPVAGGSSPQYSLRSRRVQSEVMFSPESIAWESPRVSFGESGGLENKDRSPRFMREDDKPASAKETCDGDIEVSEVDRYMSLDTSSPKGSATARFPTHETRRPKVSIQRSKSISRMPPPASNSATHALQSRATATSMRSVPKGRSSSALDCHRAEKSKQKLPTGSWAQQQLQREKQKLVRGMQKFVLSRAK